MLRLAQEYYKKYKGRTRCFFRSLTRIMKDIVERLCRIEAEQSRRKGTDRLAQYNTGEVKHEKQLAFHLSARKNPVFRNLAQNR